MVRKLGLVAWALAGTLLTYAAYFFMCGLRDAKGLLITAGAAVICLVVALATLPLVKSAKKRVITSGTASFVLLALAMCFVAGLGDPEVRMWLPIAVLFMVPLCAPMVVSISYCVAKFSDVTEAERTTAE